MSFLHPDESRSCQRCGHRWRAEKWTKLDSTPPVLGVGITARAQDLHRQTVHERRDRLYRAWRYCPECGSKNVKTLKDQGAGSSQPGAAGSSDHGQDSQQRFSVVLTDAGKKKNKVGRVLMTETGIRAKEALDLVERTPVVVFEAQEGDRARHVQAKLQAAGASTSLTESANDRTESTGTAGEGWLPEGKTRSTDTAGEGSVPEREASPAPVSIADEIEKLADLHSRGILTDAEFEAAKTRLLD